MAADQIILKADTSRPIGTRPAKRLRAQGKIPAVVYGNDTEPQAIAVEWTDLRAALITDAGMNALITLDVDGEEKLTIVKDMQRHPVRRDVTHVDFIVIDRNKPIDVEVPITLIDTDGDNLDGLVLDQVLFALPISAKPGTIPNEFEVSVAALTLDEPIRAGDIALADGVELNIDPEDAIATASVPEVFVEPEVEGEEGDEAADGETAEGDDDAEAAEGGDDAAEDDGEG